MSALGSLGRGTDSEVKPDGSHQGLAADRRTRKLTWVRPAIHLSLNALRNSVVIASVISARLFRRACCPGQSAFLSPIRKSLAGSTGRGFLRNQANELLECSYVPRQVMTGNGVPECWRPFFQQSIEELERIVHHQSGNPATLMMVAGELQHRRSQRARTLAGRVESLLQRTSSQPALPPRSVQQTQLGAGINHPRALPAPNLRPGQRSLPAPDQGQRQLPPGQLDDVGHAPRLNQQSTDPTSPRIPEWAKLLLVGLVLLILFRLSAR